MMDWLGSLFSGTAFGGAPDPSTLKPYYDPAQDFYGTGTMTGLEGNKYWASPSGFSMKDAGGILGAVGDQMFGKQSQPLTGAPSGGISTHSAQGNYGPGIQLPYPMQVALMRELMKRQGIG